MSSPNLFPNQSEWVLSGFILLPSQVNAFYDCVDCLAVWLLYCFCCDCAALQSPMPYCMICHKNFPKVFLVVKTFFTTAFLVSYTEYFNIRSHRHKFSVQMGLKSLFIQVLIKAQTTECTQLVCQSPWCVVCLRFWIWQQVYTGVEHNRGKKLNCL